MSRCTLHGGPFLVQRTIFLVQRAMFLRPLDEGRPQGAKKVGALDAFGAPRRAFLVQKCKEIPQYRPKGRKNLEKGHPKIDAKSNAEKRYQKYTNSLPK